MNTPVVSTTKYQPKEIKVNENETCVHALGWNCKGLVPLRSGEKNPNIEN